MAGGIGWFTQERGVRITLSIIVAALLWLSVKMVKPYHTQVEVPVRYVGIPANFKLVQQLPDRLQVSVYGIGHQLIFPNQRWLRDTLELDLSKSLGTRRLETRTWLPEITRYLPSALTVEAVQPDTVGLRFEDKIYKRVPVVSALNLEFLPGYSLLRPIIFQPDSVLLQATSTELRDITSWPTEQRTVEQIGDSQIVEVKLAESENIFVKPTQVLAEIDVARFTEKTYSLKIEVRNLPAGISLRLLPEVVEVVCQVPFDRYNEVRLEDFTVAVDYQTIVEGSTVLMPKITRQPDYVQRVRIVPATVDFVRTER